MTEAEFDISPPGLRGLNRLAARLNALMEGKQIADWHLGRWSGRDQTKHGILFDNDDDAAMAKISSDDTKGDLADCGKGT